MAANDGPARIHVAKQSLNLLRYNRPAPKQYHRLAPTRHHACIVLIEILGSRSFAEVVSTCHVVSQLFLPSLSAFLFS